MKKFLEKNQHILSIVCPILVGLVFLVLCCLNINSSIWFDEAYSSYLVRGNFGDIWHLTSMDVHPPLYYFALKSWSLIFGNSVVAMRFMSVFFGFVAIVLAFHLVKKLFGMKSAIASSLLMAVSPMLIRYSQEMRMYTMILAIVLAATFVLTIALEKQDTSPKAARKFWVLYAVLICLGMWTQYLVALAWIAHIIYMFYYKGGWKAFWKDKKFIKNLLLTYLLAVALYLPWIPSFFMQTASVQGGFWIPEVSSMTIPNFLTETLIFCNAENVKSWINILLVVVAGLIIFYLVRIAKSASKKEKRKYALIASLVVLPVVMLVVLSLPPLSPVFVNRYVLYSATLLWVLIGVVIAAIKVKRKLPYVLMVGGMVVFAVIGAVNVTNRNPDGHILYTLQPTFEFAEAGEPIVAQSDWNYYDAVAYSSEKHPIYFYSNWSNYQWGSLEPIRYYHYNVFDDMDEFLKNHDKFWVITNVGEEPAEEFADYKVVNTVSDDYHIAWQLSVL